MFGLFSCNSFSFLDIIKMILTIFDLSSVLVLLCLFHCFVAVSGILLLVRCLVLRSTLMSQSWLFNIFLLLLMFLLYRLKKHFCDVMSFIMYLNFKKIYKILLDWYQIPGQVYLHFLFIYFYTLIHFLLYSRILLLLPMQQTVFCQNQIMNIWCNFLFGGL